WRVRDLPSGGRELLAGAERAADEAEPAVAAPTAGPAAVPYGVLASGALAVSAPLGMLTPAQSSAVLAAAGQKGTVIATPQRGLVIVPDGAQADEPAGALRALTDAG